MKKTVPFWIFSISTVVILIAFLFDGRVDQIIEHRIVTDVWISGNHAGHYYAEWLLFSLSFVLLHFVRIAVLVGVPLALVCILAGKAIDALSIPRGEKS